MIAVVFGLVVITSIAFFMPVMLMEGSEEVNKNRGIKAATTIAIIYLVIVAFGANG